MTASPAVLTLDEVSKTFERKAGWRFPGSPKPRPALRAVDGVSFTIRPGETFGLVGESGCGKSTLARIVAGLMSPSGGVIRFGSGGEAKPRIQMIFQDPFSSLNARWSVGRIIAEPIRVHGLRPPEEIRGRVGELLTQVGLSPADAAKYPQEFSGGQCQRISIARALAGEPEFLILDEPTSALDVSVQAQILTLLRDLQARFGFASLFITHNLAVVRLIAQRTAVMYLGQIVEMNETEALFSHPRHPYTRMLIDAAPDLDLSDRELRPIEGEVTAGIVEPGLCRFEPRCPWARDACRQTPCGEFREGEGSYRCLYPL